MAQDDRIRRFLSDVGLSRETKVLPLTGDASDRRYFRVLLKNEPSQVLALHTGPIEFDKLPFVNVHPRTLRFARHHGVAGSR